MEPLKKQKKEQIHSKASTPPPPSPDGILFIIFHGRFVIFNLFGKSRLYTLNCNN